MGRKILQLLNGLITFAVTVCLIGAGAYAGFSLWDNQQVYDSAESVFAELKDIRATIQTPTLSAMEQLLEENRQKREAEAAEKAAAEAAEKAAAEAEEKAAAEKAAAETAEKDGENQRADSGAVQAAAAKLGGNVFEEFGTEEAASGRTEEPRSALKEEPASEPTEEMTAEPTKTLTAEPTERASEEPTKGPTSELKEETSEEPTKAPTPEPTEDKSGEPTKAPTVEPTEKTTEETTETPTAEPTEKLTAELTKEPTPEPTEKPTPEQTEKPTPEPTKKATPEPTEEPTPEPTAEPTPEPTPDNSPFGQLKQINQDITAWITMPGTEIDYPVLQGTSNYSYINTDVYGNFALAGSIFLDSRNDAGYNDLYSLLYGHNMSQHRMFSDVNLYKDEAFFRENKLGLMLLPDGYHILESISVFLTHASDSGLFNPENWTYLDAEGILRMATENAMYICEDGLEALKTQLAQAEETGEMPRIVSLSTCSDEFTDARTILLTLMDP